MIGEVGHVIAAVALIASATVGLVGGELSSAAYLALVGGGAAIGGGPAAIAKLRGE